ncbi:PREDICTED: interleukin-8-like [Gekko japonicus]|uniref:Interleukin-8-like n=1 Tax=Gekko japonicus TaxID=146911 RepID=A0ABM1KSG8_GEKJA|nr:PREDICTED: interleukin-8-like [Gekko japonicus]
MRPSFALLLLALLVGCHTSTAAIFDPDGLNCRCNRVTSAFIHPSKYASIKITLPGITCRRTEIIIKLKKTEKFVCIDPEAKWVKNVLAAIKHRNSPQKTKFQVKETDEQQKSPKM